MRTHRHHWASCGEPGRSVGSGEFFSNLTVVLLVMLLIALFMLVT